MIVVCPGCTRRYRLGDAVLAGPPRKVRCSGCGQVFEAKAAAPAALPRPADGSAPLVLIAEPDQAFRAAVQRALEGFGCRIEVAENGEQAFRLAVARRPRLILLNIRLQGLSGLSVCEGVKGSPDLKATRVALIGPAGWLARADRPPPAVAKADDRLELGMSAPDLGRRLARLLGTPAAGPPGKAPAPAAPGPAAPEPRAPGPREEIRRIARAILSDMKVYHPERFEEALKSGRFLEVFREELLRGKEMIAQRFPDLPERLGLLSAALREGLDEERAAAG